MKRRNVVLASAAAVIGAPTLPYLAQAASARLVRFGQSASLTGGQAGYGKDVQNGLMAAFAAASAHETSTGIRYELSTFDDGGVRSRCMKNVIGLVEAGVTGIIGLTSGAGAEACLPVIEDAQIAMLGTRAATWASAPPTSAAPSMCAPATTLNTSACCLTSKTSGCAASAW